MDTMNPMKLIDSRTRIEFACNGDAASVRSYGKGQDLLLLLAVCTYSMIRRMCDDNEANTTELLTRYVRILGKVANPTDCVTIDLKEAMRQKGQQQ